MKHSENLAKVTEIANKKFDKICDPCGFQKRPGVLSSGCKITNSSCTLMLCPMIRARLATDADCFGLHLMRRIGNFEGCGGCQFSYNSGFCFEDYQSMSVGYSMTVREWPKSMTDEQKKKALLALKEHGISVRVPREVADEAES